MSTRVSTEFFAQPTLDVARGLIGTVLVRGGCKGRIIEVEAYTDDEASHGIRRTGRSNIMHDTYGMVYVYLIYGMYYCLNFTTDRRNVGAVLIRAAEPLSGLTMMRKRRTVDDIGRLCNGPGKLAMAFGIDDRLNWSPVGKELSLFAGDAGKVVTSRRIGITKAAQLPWRFYEKNNPFVSRP